MPEQELGAAQSHTAPSQCQFVEAEALRVSEALYRSVVEGSLQGIIIQQDGRIVYANPAMAQLFAYESPEEMIGLSPFEDLIADEDLEVFRSRTAAVYRGEHVAPHPGWRARRRDGKAVWLISTAHTSEWQGQPAVTSFYADITERKIAETAMRESEARYRSALTAGRMGAWETDLVARTRIWTEEGLALFGLTLPGGQGQVGGDADEYSSSFHPDDRHLIAHFYRLADALDSFPAEYRIVRPDGTMLWLSGRGQVVSRTPDGKARRLVSIMADISERKSAELHIQFLMKEISHRSKNLLAVIQSIAHQTAKSSTSLEQFLTGFENRIHGLAASHDVLVRETWRGARLGDLVREQLIPFIELDNTRIEIDGPLVLISADAAQPIGLAIHELATNAVKHGALSVATGRVKVSWAFDDDLCGGLRLRWTERGGPHVVPPTHKGFGHVVLHDMLSSSLSAGIVMDFAAHGVSWIASIPASFVETSSAG